ncbi:MAG: hypothetical protein ABI685_11405 [Ferruginibacter sp.]
MKVKLLLIAMFLLAGTITTFAGTPVKLTKTVSSVKSHFSTLSINVVQLEKNKVNEKADDCFTYNIVINGCQLGGSWCLGVGAFIEWCVAWLEQQN